MWVFSQFFILCVLLVHACSVRVTNFVSILHLYILFHSIMYLYGENPILWKLCSKTCLMCAQLKISFSSRVITVLSEYIFVWGFPAILGHLRNEGLQATKECNSMFDKPWTKAAFHKISLHWPPPLCSVIKGEPFVFHSACCNCFVFFSNLLTPQLMPEISNANPEKDDKLLCPALMPHSPPNHLTFMVRTMEWGASASIWLLTLSLDYTQPMTSLIRALVSKQY